MTDRYYAANGTDETEVFPTAADALRVGKERKMAPFTVYVLLPQPVTLCHFNAAPGQD